MQDGEARALSLAAELCLAARVAKLNVAVAVTIQSCTHLCDVWYAAYARDNDDTFLSGSRIVLVM